MLQMVGVLLRVGRCLILACPFWNSNWNGSRLVTNNLTLDWHSWSDFYILCVRGGGHTKIWKYNLLLDNSTNVGKQAGAEGAGKMERKVTLFICIYYPQFNYTKLVDNLQSFPLTMCKIEKASASLSFMWAFDQNKNCCFPSYQLCWASLSQPHQTIEQAITQRRVFRAGQ